MPKALVPLAGKPLLQWQVDKLRDAGITDIIVNVHHFPDMIIDAIRANKGWGCNITVSDERDMLLDTGGGLKKAVGEEPILACNVDILSNIDLRALVGAYERTGVSQLVVSERKTQRYLCFDDKDRLCGWTNIATGEIKGKEGRHLAFSGLQILNGEALYLLQQIPEDKFLSNDGCRKNRSNRRGRAIRRKLVKQEKMPFGIFFVGVPRGTRTLDPLIKSQLLYQLS